MTIRFSHRFPSLLVAALLAAPAFAASDYLLQLEGIPGESKERAANRSGLIEIESFSLGTSNPGTVVGSIGGGGAGKVSFSDISFSKQLDKSSPLLYLRTANGVRIPSAMLFVRKAGETPLEYYTIKLTDVLVTSMQTGGHAGGSSVPNESFSLNFAKIEFDYKPQKADGSLDTSVKSGWDLLNNRGI